MKICPIIGEAPCELSGLDAFSFYVGAEQIAGMVHSQGCTIYNALSSIAVVGTRGEKLRHLQQTAGMPNAAPIYQRTFIREWREERGLSVRELAEAVGMDKGNLSKLENGHHPYNQRTLEPIANRLGVSTDTLMKRRPQDPVPLMDFYLKANAKLRRQIDAAAEAIYRAAEQDEE